MGRIIGYLSLGAVALLAVFLVSTYINFYNIGVQHEQNIGAVWQENQVVLNTYTTKVQETAQVPDMYRDDLTKVIEATFSGRYGENGSQAVFQWIQEQNLNLDPVLYRQIQQVMESGRNDFQTAQRKLIDAKRSYQTLLGFFWSGTWLRLAGYPKVDLNKFTIVVLDDVQQKFNTGKDEVIRLR